MKKTLLSIFISLFFIVNAHSAVTSVTGKVGLIRSHLLSVSPDWVTLTGITAAGTCPLVSGGPYFVMGDDERGKRHLSILLAAKMSGAIVVIWYDDTIKNSTGSCEISFIDI